MEGVFYLTLTILFTTSSQFMQKRYAINPEQGRIFVRLPFAATKNLLLAIVFMVLAMTFWILTLSIMDLSKAYPLLSLNYVLVLLVSHYRLQERIMCKQVVGVTFILFGVFLLGIG